jgi:hypothetical protein
MRKLASALAALCACAYSQSTPQVTITETPASIATEVLNYRDGSGNTEYVCIALGRNVQATWTRSAASSVQPSTPAAVGQGTLTSIVDSASTSTVTTSVAHGLSVGQWITISGATVDTDLNGEYKIATAPSSTTFTITTANVTDATYNESTLQFSSTAPRTNANVWSIQRLYYTSNSFDRSIWAKGSTAADKPCDSRTTYF